jgi:hypothetical protein
MNNEETRQPIQVANGPASELRNIRPAGLLGWLPWVVAAVFAALTGVMVQIHYVSQTELVTLRDQAALAGIELKSLQQRIEAEHILSARRTADLVAELHSQSRPRVEIVSLLPRGDGNPASIAVAIWSLGLPEGELVVERLPVLTADKCYQLWITDPKNPTPAAAGTFAIGSSPPSPFRLGRCSPSASSAGTEPQTSKARWSFQVNRPISHATFSSAVLSPDSIRPSWAAQPGASMGQPGAKRQSYGGRDPGGPHRR